MAVLEASPRDEVMQARSDAGIAHGYAPEKSEEPEPDPRQIATVSV
ncbi:hypothetical protein [Methylophaga thiooxydans]|nr:hypothetical protein [Methylophaga thiooxydans]